MSLSGSGSGSVRGLGVVADKPQPAVQAGDAAGREKKQRLKREDHVHVKHDDCFSEWKVLVGPSDWKKHASGKTQDRFRISNLSSNYGGSGVYELGVTPPVWLPPQRSDDSSLKPQGVVVVYLGCSDNMHQHLLRYGQTGAHLEGVRSTRLFAVKNDRADSGWSKADVQQSNGEVVRSTSFTKDRLSGDGGYMSGAGSRQTSNASMDAGDESAAPSTSNQKTFGSPSFDQLLGSVSLRGPRLFSEVFALGCSIAFRWAATDSKTEAERAEADLMEIFDYAWKRGGNFRQRSPDILAKIVMGGAQGSNDTSYGCFGDRSARTWWSFQRARVGVPIAARKPGATEGIRSTSSRTDRSRVGDSFFTLFRTREGCRSTAKSSEFTKLDIPLDRCGAPLENGFPCNALPVKGGKRCHLHKDQRRQTQGKRGRVAHTNQLSPARGTSASRASRVSRASDNVPEEAKSPILPGPEPTPSSSSCFPYLMTTPAVPASNRSSPEPKRRGSLSFTTWLRTSEIRMAKSCEWAADQPPQSDATADGPKRSFSSTYNSILATMMEESQHESPSRSPCASPSRRHICGLRLDDGTVCPEPPRPDRKRCQAHKGLRNQSLKSPRSSTSLKYNNTSRSIPSMHGGFF